LFLCLISTISLSLFESDELFLELKLHSGNEQEKKYSEKIHNLLNISNRHKPFAILIILKLITIIYLILLLDKLILNKNIKLIFSLLILLIFNEILPQIFCKKNQLLFAGYFSEYISSLMNLTFFITIPIGKILNYLLGNQHRHHFLNADLKALIEIHKISNNNNNNSNEEINSINEESKTIDHLYSPINNINYNSSNENINFNEEKIGLNEDQANLMISALEIKEKKAKDIMIPLNKVYSIAYDQKLSKETIAEILSKGYSRIPVYIKKKEDSSIEIIGLVRIKQLIGLDLYENKSLKEFNIKICKPLVIHPNKSLMDLLKEFRLGKSHMAFVTENVENLEYRLGLNNKNNENNFGINKRKLSDSININNKILGIITIEDVIEKLFKFEILDEDDYEKQTNKIYFINNTNYNNYVNINEEFSKENFEKKNNFFENENDFDSVNNNVYNDSTENNNIII
jgi:metal transporter CNNM